MAPKKKPGRPKKAASERRAVDIRIPVTKDEKRLIQDAAGQSERGELADWARTALLAAATNALK